jgi:hypothetical protein
LSAESVSAVWPHPDEVWDVTLSDGTVVHTTGNHPWWDDTQRAWIRADHLVNGDQVLTVDGSTITVTSVEDTGSTQPTYNLTVTGPHTYYVGDDQILVHNCVVIDYSKPGLNQEMVERGWSKQDIEQLMANGPTGVSRDLRSPPNTFDHVARNDPATVYGQAPNNYVVINDRTGEVVQIADKRNPNWAPDGRIIWGENK